MLQTVNWVILPNGMMQNTLQLIMPQVCHITYSAILPALTLHGERVTWYTMGSFKLQFSLGFVTSCLVIMNISIA